MDYQLPEGLSEGCRDLVSWMLTAGRGGPLVGHIKHSALSAFVLIAPCMLSGVCGFGPMVVADS